MCGRFVQVSSPDLLVERFGVHEVATPHHEPSWNVAPRATVYAVRDRTVDDDRRRYLSELRWGLVPSWAKDPRSGDRMINARAESLADKPAYQRAFQKHRCLVPAEGFYEWQRRGGRKQPMFIHRRDGEPMALAGLWAAWRGEGGFADPRRKAGACDGDKEERYEGEPDGDWLRSCAIVTTNANDTIAPLHDRMPVVLEERDWDRWLDPIATETDALGRMLTPAADDLLVAYPVGTRVNSADNDGPDLVERVALEATLDL
jgi:putative SOS response-associated peptidase YedK